MALCKNSLLKYRLKKHINPLNSENNSIKNKKIKSKDKKQK